jgi:hypothetical protein
MNKSLQILDITTTTVDTDLFNITAINSKRDPYWVEFMEPYAKEAGVEIKILPLHQIDLTKKWLINVDINSWNWKAHTGSIIAEFDPLIQKELKLGNAFLILNHQCESFTKSFLNVIYKKVFDIPFNKIIYMVAAADIEQEYMNFVKENNIKNKLTVMYVHHVYKRFKHDVNLEYFKYSPIKKTKKYLSLNRRGRDHRIMLTSLLSYKNLLDQGFVSLGIMSNESTGAMRKLTSNNQRIGFSKFKDRLPLQVDDVDLSINQFQMNSLPIEFYQQSCFSLVSSTMALKSDEGSVGFTEKEIKPILAKHPFIILNRPGVLKHMKSMGFLTFERWFDESYDSELNDESRIEQIVNEVERLCKFSFEQWDIMLEEMSPILEHNYNRLVNYTTEHCYFNSDLKKLLYYVS